jgi:hypothetical protein
MDFDQLQTAWRSPANTPDDRVQAQLMEHVMTTLKTRRRREIALFALPTAAMALFTTLAVQAIATGQMDPIGEWGSLAMLGVCWLVLAAVLVVGFRLRHRGRDGDTPMRDSIAALLASNRRARANVKIFWMMLPVFMAPMLFSVGQLGAAGKATERDMGQMLLVFAVALTASAGWNTARYFWVMKPEQRRLEGLLAEYEG